MNAYLFTTGDNAAMKKTGVRVTSFDVVAGERVRLADFVIVALSASRSRMRSKWACGPAQSDSKTDEYVFIRRGLMPTLVKAGARKRGVLDLREIIQR